MVFAYPKPGYAILDLESSRVSYTSNWDTGGLTRSGMRRVSSDNIDQVRNIEGSITTMCAG